MSFLFDAMSVWLKRDSFEAVGRWTQIVGTIALIATVTSGLIAKAEVTIARGAQELLETHQQIAFLVTVLACSLLLWRISTRLLLPSKHRTIYIFISFATVALTWIGAWHGGELVYAFGVGVRALAR